MGEYKPVPGGTLGQVADGLAKMGLGKSVEAAKVRAAEAAARLNPPAGTYTPVV